MLFDLRSRGRRRTVQVVYLGLAILMGGGLVLFGVGTGNGTAVCSTPSPATARAATRSGGQPAGEDGAARQTRRNPSNAAAWSALVQARWTSAGQGSNYNAPPATFTASGKKELAAPSQAWQRYLQLTKSPTRTWPSWPPAPTPRSATTPARPAPGRSRPPPSPSAAQGLRVPGRSAYAAKQTRKGDLALAKALTLVPKASRTTLKPQIAGGQDHAAASRSLLSAPRRARVAADRGLRSRLPGPLAQLAEQGTLNPKVGGSIPPRPTRESPVSRGFCRFWGLRRMRSMSPICPERGVDLADGRVYGPDLRRGTSSGSSERAARPGT